MADWTTKQGDDAAAALNRKWPFIHWSTLSFGECLGVSVAFNYPPSGAGGDLLRYAEKYYGPNDFNHLAKWAREHFANWIVRKLKDGPPETKACLEKWLNSDEKRKWVGLDG